MVLRDWDGFREREELGVGICWGLFFETLFHVVDIYGDVYIRQI